MVGAVLCEASWRWAGASSTGTSHAKTDLPCQDRASCLRVSTERGPALVAVVSDGAGSASEAGRGAAIVCSQLQRRARAYLRIGRALRDLDQETVADWIDSIRERIGASATARGLLPRDYAATLIAVLIEPDHAVTIHVGDGAAVLRKQHDQEWLVPSWPYHGQFASTTRFVVDDPQAQTVLTHVEATIDRFAVFSDGIEYLVLDFQSKTAPGPFFERLVAPLTTQVGFGRDRMLSRHLRNYLNSKVVCDETDDDKTLILGVRT